MRVIRHFGFVYVGYNFYLFNFSLDVKDVTGLDELVKKTNEELGNGSKYVCKGKYAGVDAYYIDKK